MTFCYILLVEHLL